MLEKAEEQNTDALNLGFSEHNAKWVSNLFSTYFSIQQIPITSARQQWQKKDTCIILFGH